MLNILYLLSLLAGTFMILYIIYKITDFSIPYENVLLVNPSELTVENAIRCNIRLCGGAIHIVSNKYSEEISKIINIMSRRYFQLDYQILDSNQHF